MSDRPPHGLLGELDRPIEVPPGFGEQLFDRLEEELRRAPGGVRMVSIEAGPSQQRTGVVSGLRAAAIAAAVVVSVGTILGGLGRSPRQDEATPSTVTPTTDPATGTVAPPERSTTTTPHLDPADAVSLAWLPPGWTLLDPGPVAAEGAGAAAWNGAELVVWAGEAAAYDPPAASWRSLGTPTVRWTEGAILAAGNGRIAAVAGDGDVSILRDTWVGAAPRPEVVRHLVDALWVGDLLYVVAHIQHQARLSDELVLVVYDPETDAWRVLSAPPLNLSYGDLTWSGTELIVYGGFLDANNFPRSADGHAAGARYDPLRDAWDMLDPHLLSPNSVTSEWAGDRLIAWDYNQQAAAFGIGAGWEQLAPPPMPSGECHVESAWTGEVFVAWYCGLAAMYDPINGLWGSILTPDEVALFRANALVRGAPVAGDDGAVYFWAARNDDDDARLWRLDPRRVAPARSIESTGGWSLLPATSADGRPGAGVIWTGAELIVWGGEIPFFPERPNEGWPLTSTGAAYDPGRDVWFHIPDGPLDPRRDAAVVWTGSEMLVAGGGVHGAAAYDPATGGWDPLPPHAVPSDPAHVWTGSELILWGGVAADGVAYHRQSDEWRTIADGPLTSRTGHTAIWTGDEMIVWGGLVTATGERAAQGFEIVSAQDGAAYDPSADEWRTISPLPAGLELSAHTAIWSGEEMIVWGANFEAYDRSGDLAGVSYLAGAAYHPARDRWRVIATPPFRVQDQVEGFGTHSTVWTGSRMIVWAGGGFVSATGPELWVYDPVLDVWTRGAPAPVDGEDPVLVWAGGRLYAYGGSSGSALIRTLAIDLGDGGSDLPPVPGTNRPIPLIESLPFRVLAFSLAGGAPQDAATIDLAGGVATTYSASEYHSMPGVLLGAAGIGENWVTHTDDAAWVYPRQLYRSPLVVREAAPSTQLRIAANPTLDGDERLWIIDVGTGGRVSTVRFLAGFEYPVTREVELPGRAEPVVASGNRLLVNLTGPDGRTQMVVVEKGGTVIGLGDGIGVHLALSRLIWLDCDAGPCSIRISSVVEGVDESDPVISPGDGWTFAAPLPQMGVPVGSPDGRWLVVPRYRPQTAEGVELVLVELSTGAATPIFDGLPGNLRGGPGIVWSSDSSWVMSSGEELLVAVNVKDGRRVDLGGVVPEGMVVFGVTPIS